MIYVSVALLVAAILVAIVHFRDRRDKPSTALSAIVAVLVVAVGVGSMIQVYRIGHSGAESVWGDVLTAGGSES